MAAVPAISRSNASAADLAQSLQRLSTQPDLLAKERRVLPKHPRERLERLLQEIDEIILPRVLWIEADTQNIARLHIANRQIHGLKLINSSLSDQNHADMDANAVASGIVASAKEMTGLRVSSLSDEDQRSVPTSGISLDALKAALGLSTARKSIDQLAQKLDPVSTGRLSSTGDARAEFSGDHTWQDVLNNFAKHFAEEVQREGVSASFPRGHAIPLPDGKLLVAVCDSEQAIFWVVDRTDGLTAISDWQALTPSNAV